MLELLVGQYFSEFCQTPVVQYIATSVFSLSLYSTLLNIVMESVCGLCLPIRLPVFTLTLVVYWNCDVIYVLFRFVISCFLLKTKSVTFICIMVYAEKSLVILMMSYYMKHNEIDFHY